jgi:hypothetical protein
VNDAYNYFSKTFKDSLLIFEDATTPAAPQSSVPSTPTTPTTDNNQTSDAQNGQKTDANSEV